MQSVMPEATSLPAEILSKPTKLTNFEFSLIQTHAQSGFDILIVQLGPCPEFTQGTLTFPALLRELFWSIMNGWMVPGIPTL
jgi:hypothetical protein